MLEESWKRDALRLGYTSEREMLKGMYSDRRMTLRDMAELLGYSTWAIRRRLILNKIPMRKKGRVQCQQQST